MSGGGEEAMASKVGPGRDADEQDRSVQEGRRDRLGPEPSGDKIGFPSGRQPSAYVGPPAHNRNVDVCVTC